MIRVPLAILKIKDGLARTKAGEIYTDLFLRNHDIGRSIAITLRILQNNGFNTDAYSQEEYENLIADEVAKDREREFKRREIELQQKRADEEFKKQQLELNKFGTKLPFEDI